MDYINKAENLEHLAKVLRENRPVDILCTGTPRIIGDALGPLVGTMLMSLPIKNNVKIIGTLDKPVISSTLDKRLKEVRKDSYVLVIDAVVGNKHPDIEVALGSMQPGAALTNKMPFIGHAAIKGYTGKNLSHLMHCDMHCVYSMAVTIVNYLGGLMTVFNADVAATASKDL